MHPSPAESFGISAARVALNCKLQDQDMAYAGPVASMPWSMTQTRALKPNLKIDSASNLSDAEPEEEVNLVGALVHCRVVQLTPAQSCEHINSRKHQTET
eukprot:706214-Rhodomonas_salina.2